MLTTPAPTRSTTAPSRPRVRPDRAAAPLRVVTERELQAIRARTRARRVAAVVVSLVALGLFGVVIAHVVLMQGQFELQGLQERTAASQAEYDRLRLQVSEAESPDRIVAAAHEKLGMVTPPSITYLAPSAEAAALPTTAEPSEDEPKGAAAALPDRWSSVKSQLSDG